MWYMPWSYLNYVNERPYSNMIQIVAEQVVV